jgi:hypothetical protein
VRRHQRFGRVGAEEDDLHLGLIPVRFFRGPVGVERRLIVVMRVLGNVRSTFGDTVDNEEVAEILRTHGGGE